jgi:Lar family restriction alleviation protein
MMRGGVMEELKLKPCPFCGSDAEVITRNYYGLRDSFLVECASCGVATPEFDDSVDDATDAWNCRALGVSE